MSPSLVPLPLHHHHHHHPPPVWGQGNSLQIPRGALSGLPLLMLVTSRDFSIIRRSIESVLQSTGGSGLELVVSVSSPSTSLLDLLHQYPIKVHTSTPSTSQDHSYGSGHFKSLIRRVIPQFPSVGSFNNFLHGFTDKGVCKKDEWSPKITILKTGANYTQTSLYKLTMEDINKQERGTPYMEHPYNPMFLKALNNHILDGTGGSNDREGTHVNKNDIPMYRKGNIGKDGKAICQKSNELKAALQFVKDSYPKLQYLMLMETGYTLAPDFMSFLNQALHATQSDPSVYCISAHNPLALPRPIQPKLQTTFDTLHPFTDSAQPTTDTLNSGADSSYLKTHPLHLTPEHTRLLRYDHFLATATLIPMKVVDEIINEFVIYEDTTVMEDKKSTLSWLETWLSWWSRRRGRACIVPSIPRVCPLPHQQEEEEGHSQQQQQLHNLSLCSQHTQTTFYTERLLHYQYSQDLMGSVEEAEPLGVRQFNCSHPDFFPDVLNSSVYIIYLNMENYDDDFTLHHYLKCFGLDLPSAVGYFEGVFQLTYHNIHLLLMGIPYSPYSPSIKNREALLAADIPDLYIRGQTNYQKFKHRQFSFDTVIVRQKII